jgi:hypothetical protein
MHRTTKTTGVKVNNARVISDVICGKTHIYDFLSKVGFDVSAMKM